MPGASVRLIAVWFIRQLGEVFGPFCQIVVGVCDGKQHVFRRIVADADGPFAGASGARLPFFNGSVARHGETMPSVGRDGKSVPRAPSPTRPLVANDCFQDRPLRVQMAR
jgi:hypothetical protein